MSKFFVVTSCLLMLTFSVSAQKALNKAVDSWSKDDAMEILSSSPWAKMYSSTEGAAAASQSDALQAQSATQRNSRIQTSEQGRSERSGGQAPVIFRLHSGLPIRLALTRLNQISAGYDKLNDEAKAKFNESGKKLLDCQICQNYYVVTMTKMPNPSGQGVEEAIFQGMTLEQMNGNVSLRNDRGDTRELFQFIPPEKRGDSAVLFFPRKDDKGDVFLTKDNTEFTLVFNPSFFTSSNRFASLIPRQLEFKMSKIIVNGMVVF